MLLTPQEPASAITLPVKPTHCWVQFQCLCDHVSAPVSECNIKRPPPPPAHAQTPAPSVGAVPTFSLDDVVWRLRAGSGQAESDGGTAAHVDQTGRTNYCGGSVMTVLTANAMTRGPAIDVPSILEAAYIIVLKKEELEEQGNRAWVTCRVIFKLRRSVPLARCRLPVALIVAKSVAIPTPRSYETGTAVRLGWTAQSKNTTVAGPVKPGVTRARITVSNALPLHETSEEVTSSTKGTVKNEHTVSEPSLICSFDEPQGRKGKVIALASLGNT
ncbi:hypothetical protein DFH08DRAFT_807376 [Mycena albidolilacea]|uniref:Uncharacterized protein n=1 Tax=Mycena albidolilacea TaxID=1033008 RepID=A0AAD7A5N5_9AGAR|nr:hypothetical protein DFH08DRAFT_807376 [Mycena albidolilacea]